MSRRGMKKLFFIALFSLLYSGISRAQVSHEVSGIVTDSTENAVIGATITLMSAKDTLKTSTNLDGIFIFKNVQAGQFTISVRLLGYLNYNKRFLFNEATKRLVLDPIVIKSQSTTLNEVVVNGTPAIVYKEDTVEYRASDYKVRENATVDELLKKMEGVEVGTDGTVMAQGLQVTKARLNGKDYSGGDLAAAIENLPADIVEKIQIVDDYGDQAARTGIKDGDPQKVLNIVTKASRSVGNTARINAGAGNNERYGASVFGNRINGNQQLNTNLNFNNSVNGVAGGNSNAFSGNISSGRGGGNNQGNGNNNSGGQGSSGASGGISTRGRGSVGYRDQWGKKISFNGSYSYNFTDNNSLNSSISERYSTNGTTYSAHESNSDNNTKNHTFNIDFEYDIDSANFLRVQPTISYSSTHTNSLSSNVQTGFIHRTDNSSNSGRNTSPNLGGSLLYQHIFKKQGRNFSLNLNYTRNRQERDNGQNARILYYQQDTTANILIKDSLVNRLVLRRNLNNTFRASTTFSERLGTKSRIDFNAQMNRRSYDNEAHTNNVNAAGLQTPVDSLSNIFNYSFTESRLSLNYRFTQTKYNFSLGLTGIPTLLEGTKVHLNATTRRSNFYLIPIMRFEYQFSRQHRFSLNYSGNASEPSFDQIQPVRDVSRANNPVVGNPNLKAAFNHTISAAYNNYIPNSRLNYSVNLNARRVDNSVVSNVVEIRDSLSYINETRYVNMDGASSVSGNYNISKSFANRKYSLRLNGSVSNRNGVSMSNNARNTSTSWSFSERLGLQINPVEWLELNPNVNYTFNKANFSLPTSMDSRTRNISLNGDGKVYLNKTLLLSFNAGKNFVSGINANVTNNPFVINSSIEKQFFKRRNGALSLQAFDVLNQNNFIERDISDNGFTDTKTNALSRYFMLNFRWTPQKWTGASPSRNGRQMMRRGDGSFY